MMTKYRGSNNDICETCSIRFLPLAELRKRFRVVAYPKKTFVLVRVEHPIGLQPFQYVIMTRHNDEFFRGHTCHCFFVAIHIVLATFRSTTLVNSSKIDVSFRNNLFAKSTRIFSPLDSTEYGFNQLGTLPKPTA